MEVRDWLRTLPAGVDLRELLTAASEKGLIERALEQANGVQAEAARMLGVSRSDIRIQSRNIFARSTNGYHLVQNRYPYFPTATRRDFSEASNAPL